MGAARQARRVLEEVRPEVVHTQYYGIGILLPRLLKDGAAARTYGARSAVVGTSGVDDGSGGRAVAGPYWTMEIANCYALDGWLAKCDEFSITVLVRALYALWFFFKIEKSSSAQSCANHKCWAAHSCEVATAQISFCRTTRGT